MGEVAEAQAALFLGRGDAVQSEFPHPRPQVAWECVVAVDLRGARSDFVRGEVSGAVADHRSALAEIEVELTRRVGNHGRGAGRGSEETTLCGIGDAVPPFAIACGAISFRPRVLLARAVDPAPTEWVDDRAFALRSENAFTCCDLKTGAR